ncbi:MAG: DegT/DnrJ/EryC1/StrS family aminotransferase [Spirulinaceae cyanobacterium SM2_1_0]|nr:DegT/DnrJ/EryC1/StrS family aminotransferase [Spirulinaceae cyanobacterium SM2_1_0]
MSAQSVRVPFVDLTRQHEPLKAALEQAVLGVMERGDFILSGTLAKFEQAFAAASGVTEAVGVASGTDAIALGLQACGIGPGDEVIVPANTFIATIIGIRRTGARPVLVDCDLETALIDLDAARRAVTPKTKAIVPVHLYGQMVSPAALDAFVRDCNVLVFEDAAQAHLAEREGRIAGSLGVGAAYSFYPSKNLGAFGDGGIFITSDGDLARTVRTYRNYGAAKKYVHTELGTNSRLDSLQAAVLSVKLPHLKDWNAARNQSAAQYDQAFAARPKLGIVPMRNDSGTGHIYHLYVVRVRPESGCDRDKLQAALAEQGIQSGIHYPIACHLQPAYADLGYQTGDFPNAETLCAQILSLPMFPGLTAAEIEATVAAITAVMIAAKV